MNAGDRFFLKVEPDGNGCLIWNGALDSNGYGRFFGYGENRPAHRWLLERLGDIPEGLVADHLCRNPRCVRPAHIEFVTPRENIIRGEGPTNSRARAAARTHCAHGHPWTEETTYIFFDRGGKRHRLCKPCGADRRKTDAGRSYQKVYARMRKANARLLAAHPRVAVLHSFTGPLIHVHVTAGDTLEDLNAERIAALADYRETKAAVAA